jgi:hypothetical protein
LFPLHEPQGIVTVFIIVPPNQFIILPSPVFLFLLQFKK